MRLFRTPRFDRTLEGWLNVPVDSGFVLERVQEPRPTKEQVCNEPGLDEMTIVPWFIHFRWRKPGR